MSVSESDLKNQLEGLDWGVPTPAPAPEAAPVQDDAGTSDALDIDVAVPGVKPATRKRGGRPKRVTRGPNAQALLDKVTDGASSPTPAPAIASGRRPRTAPPDVLVAAGEGPATIALFDAMWKDVGSKLARGIGRPKISRQDAAVGWYMLLLAMRERDAGK